MSFLLKITMGLQEILVLRQDLCYGHQPTVGGQTGIPTDTYADA